MWKTSGRASHRLRDRAIALIAAAGVGIITFTLLTVPTEEARAADSAEHTLIDQGADDAPRTETASIATASLAGFDPSNIISDPVFYNQNAMSEAEIANFIRQKGASCTSTAAATCMKDYSQGTYSFPGDRYCSGYNSSGTESAARMIWLSAQACGISPQVLLVTLQKEQSLVTQRQTPVTYQRAMGYGCPDNAGGQCDPNFAGFHVQVYYAARQFVRYGDSSLFKAYPVGQVSNILFFPPNKDGSNPCGSSPVRIANQATRNLYIYTPYQPNAASLAAGWGTGDGCSAYGNRNFYNYFTDWFGSTQSSVTAMVSVGADIYFLTGGTRIHLTAESWPEFYKVFGWPVSVSRQYLNLHADAGDASLFVRNSSTGDISLIQDGRRHRFESCAELASWGGSCSNSTVIAAAHYEAIPASVEVGQLVRNGTAGTVYWFRDGRMHPLYNWDALLSVAAGANPTSVKMTPSVFARYPIAETKFATDKLIRPAGEDRVYLPTWDNRLIYIPTYDVTNGLGISSSTALNVPGSALAGYQRSGTLGMLVECGGVRYIGSGGTLIPVTAASVDGFDVTRLDDGACSRLNLSGDQPADRVFVKGAGLGEIYLASAGTLRRVPSMAALYALDGPRPRVVTVEPGVVAMQRKGADLSNEDVSPAIARAGDDFYLISGGRRAHLTLANYQQFIAVLGPALTVSRAYVDRFADGGVAGPYLRDASTGEIALFQNGTRARFDSCAEVAAWGGSCGAETALSTVHFARIPAVAEVGRFVSSGSGPTVYLIENGQLLPIHNPAAMRAANNGVDGGAVTIMPAAAFARYPIGRTLFAPATLVKSATGAAVYLATWDGRLLHLPSFDYAGAWGMSRSFVTVPDSALRQYRSDGAVSLFVSCGDQTLVASAGTLRPVSSAAAAGFSISVLEERTCAALTRTSFSPLAQVFLQGEGRGEIYLAQSGALRHVTDFATLLRLGGGALPAITLSPASIIDTMPKGSPIAG